MITSIKKFSSTPYAQAKIYFYDDGIEYKHCSLISYTTEVAYILCSGWVFVNGLYSMTTRKHLSTFAKEYCNTTYDILKKCYEKNLAYNINTKEFLDVETGEILGS